MPNNFSALSTVSLLRTKASYFSITFHVCLDMAKIVYCPDFLSFQATIALSDNHLNTAAIAARSFFDLKSLTRSSDSKYFRCSRHCAKSALDGFKEIFVFMCFFLKSHKNLYQNQFFKLHLTDFLIESFRCS